MVDNKVDFPHKISPNNSWRVLVVDDEILSRIGIKNILKQRHPDFEVVAEAESIYTATWPKDSANYTPPAFELLNSSGRIDGIILDINIDSEPKNVAIDFALAVSRKIHPPWVIFMTAAIENARKAHGVHAIDFWDKPFDITKIDITLDGVRRNKPIFKESRLSIKHRVLNRSGESEWHTRFVEINDIRYIQKDTNANTSHVRLVKDDILDGINTTIANWEDRLSQHNFIKINKGCIVNRTLVNGIRTATSGKIYATFFESNDEVPISPEYVNKLYA